MCEKRKQRHVIITCYTWWWESGNNVLGTKCINIEQTMAQELGEVWCNDSLSCWQEKGVGKKTQEWGITINIFVSSGKGMV